jgi:hypothetical protein
MTRKPPEGLVNAERPAGDKPAPAPEKADPFRSYFHGPAGRQVDYWRRRALLAEAALAEIARKLRTRPNSAD